MGRRCPKEGKAGKRGGAGLPTTVWAFGKPGPRRSPATQLAQQRRRPRLGGATGGRGGSRAYHVSSREGPKPKAVNGEELEF
ncbi:hypothetical protein AXF42_Ash021538 [Apostasia shenzhenica]|uniref:Uncharacterized protein n=1 Tax=Apostasia shenzhenica TaxID=1088818 RepID=A0A2H9ZTV8_9ASPA|nr:hypothetical protein AXF42_Ash021538 [Apostasia shenzhenica]